MLEWCTDILTALAVKIALHLTPPQISTGFFDFPCDENFKKGFVATLEYSEGRSQRAGRRGDLVGMAAMPSFGDTFNILKINQNPFITTL